MKTKIKIEKGVPIPPPNSKGTRYPLDDMAIGDSIVVPMSKSASILSLASRLQPKKFTSRRMIENDTKIVRLWRVA